MSLVSSCYASLMSTVVLYFSQDSVLNMGFIQYNKRAIFVLYLLFLYKILLLIQSTQFSFVLSL